MDRVRAPVWVWVVVGRATGPRPVVYATRALARAAFDPPDGWAWDEERSRWWKNGEVVVRLERWALVTGGGDGA